MDGLVRWTVRIFAAIPIIGIAFWLTLVPGDRNLFPADETAERPVWVVNHGWHTGLVIGQAELRAAMLEIKPINPQAAERLRWLTTRYPGAEWLEIGWGDAAFYQQTPTVEDVDVLLGLKALIVPTDSAMQVVPGWGPPTAAFPNSDQIRLPLSPDGFQRLVAKLADTVSAEDEPPQLGTALYGSGHFYPAEPSYHLFRTCNHWIAGLLRMAGVPASHLPSTFSKTLLAELRFRAANIEDDLR